MTNREIDAMVAKHVFGFGDRVKMIRPDTPIIDDAFSVSVRRYTEDIAAAWEVRVRLSELGWDSNDRITWMGWTSPPAQPYGYSIWFERWVNHEKTCHHSHVKDKALAPMAICLAALKAVGVEVPA